MVVAPSVFLASIRSTVLSIIVPRWDQLVASSHRLLWLNLVDCLFCRNIQPKLRRIAQLQPNKGFNLFGGLFLTLQLLHAGVLVKQDVDVVFLDFAHVETTILAVKHFDLVILIQLHVNAHFFFDLSAGTLEWRLSLVDFALRNSVHTCRLMGLNEEYFGLFKVKDYHAEDRSVGIPVIDHFKDLIWIELQVRQESGQFLDYQGKELLDFPVMELEITERFQVDHLVDEVMEHLL